MVFADPCKPFDFAQGRESDRMTQDRKPVERVLEWPFDFAQDLEVLERPFVFAQGLEVLERPLEVLRAMSPIEWLRTVSLSNGFSKGPPTLRRALRFSKG